MITLQVCLVEKNFITVILQLVEEDDSEGKLDLESFYGKLNNDNELNESRSDLKNDRQNA